MQHHLVLLARMASFSLARRARGAARPSLDVTLQQSDQSASVISGAMRLSLLVHLIGIDRQAWQAVSIGIRQSQDEP